MYTSFSSVSFLKYPVRHDEGIIFIARNKHIRDRFEIQVNKLSFLGFIVEERSILEAGVPRSFERIRVMHFSILLNFFDKTRFQDSLLLRHLLQKPLYPLHHYSLTGFLRLTSDYEAEIIFFIKNEL